MNKDFRGIKMDDVDRNDEHTSGRKGTGIAAEPMTMSEAMTAVGSATLADRNDSTHTGTVEGDRDFFRHAQNYGTVLTEDEANLMVARSSVDPEAIMMGASISPDVVEVGELISDEGINDLAKKMAEVGIYLPTTMPDEDKIAFLEGLSKAEEEMDTKSTEEILSGDDLLSQSMGLGDAFNALRDLNIESMKKTPTFDDFLNTRIDERIELFFDRMKEQSAGK